MYTETLCCIIIHMFGCVREGIDRKVYNVCKYLRYAQEQLLCFLMILTHRESSLSFSYAYCNLVCYCVYFINFLMETVRAESLQTISTFH